MRYRKEKKESINIVKEENNYDQKFELSDFFS
jgi:hypothetical protein